MNTILIPAKFRNFFHRPPAWPFLLFWALVYTVGLHPDAPWGDGTGYAISVQQGFDLACNANSHFAYLNFHHLILKFSGYGNALRLLGFGSVFWAIISLYLTYLIMLHICGREGKGIFCINMLASCFAFWRLSCIPEVYTMELSFFAGSLFCFLKWIRSRNLIWFYFFALIHSIGLLVHIHLILMFPLYLLAWIASRRKFPWTVFVFYLIPIIAFFISVEILRLHTWSQILFENQQGQLLSFHWFRLLKGPFYAGGMLIFMMPGLLWIPFSKKENQIPFLSPEFLTGIILFISFFCFACLYPDPGIFVFLLPVFMLSAIAFSLVIEVSDSGIWSMAIFQTAFFILIFFSLKIFAPQSWLNSQKIKGGPGFVSLPWAKGNAASALEISRSWPMDSIPEGMRWNARQVAVLDSIRLLNKKAESR